LIVLDVAGILTDIFIALITCELNREDEPWVAPTRQALTTFSLVMSCIFMVELGLSVFSDGAQFFSSWFHRLDAFVIVGSFAVDLLEHGVAEEIASLIVVLRLWRFVKIVQEFSVEQSEQTEELRRRIEELEKQLVDLESQRAEC
jgi:membrane protein implicated in regulation of membrane protease activity